MVCWLERCLMKRVRPNTEVRQQVTQIWPFCTEHMIILFYPSSRRSQVFSHDASRASFCTRTMTIKAVLLLFWNHLSKKDSWGKRIEEGTRMCTHTHTWWIWSDHHQHQLMLHERNVVRLRKRSKARSMHDMTLTTAELHRIETQRFIMLSVPLLFWVTASILRTEQTM